MSIRFYGARLYITVSGERAVENEMKLTLTISLDMYKFLFAAPVPFRTKHLSRGKSLDKPKYSLQVTNNPSVKIISDQIRTGETHMQDTSSGSSG